MIRTETLEIGQVEILLDEQDEFGRDYVLAHLPKRQEYVTWRKIEEGNYAWGNYFSYRMYGSRIDAMQSALTDLASRVIHE